MKSKVTLRELVGTRIVYALLLGFYYWMWARRDWRGYYDTIQIMVLVFTTVFLLLQERRLRKYHKEETDELAVQNLRRADSICLKLLVVAVAAIAFLGAMMVLDAAVMGYALVGAIFALAVVRFIMFCVMDSKGI